TITVLQPTNPTANNFAAPAMPAANGTITNISAAGQYAGFTRTSPLSIVSQPPAGEGTVTVLNATTFQYTSSGFSGPTSFTYQVLGPTGSTALSPVRTVTLNPTDAPVVADSATTTPFNTFVDVD